jgi:hypothetical protein
MGCTMGDCATDLSRTLFMEGHFHVGARLPSEGGPIYLGSRSACPYPGTQCSYRALRRGPLPMEEKHLWDPKTDKGGPGYGAAPSPLPYRINDIYQTDRPNFFFFFSLSRLGRNSTRKMQRSSGTVRVAALASHLNSVLGTAGRWRSP